MHTHDAHTSELESRASISVRGHTSNRNQRRFPLILTQARLNHSWTQQDVADLISTTPQTVSRWERGIATPGPYHQRKLCDLFGFSTADFGLVAQVSQEPVAQVSQEPEESLNHVSILEQPIETSTKDAENDPQRSNNVEVSQRKEIVALPLLPLSRQPSRQHLLPSQWLHFALLLSCMVGLLASQVASVASVASATATNPKPVSNSIGGTIALLSSNLSTSENGVQGMNDEVMIHLVDIPAPAPGTGYYAWITGSIESETIWVPLGWLIWTSSATRKSVNVRLGTASLFFLSPQHANLLVAYNRFLVTQEGTIVPPQQPSSAWIAQASISTLPTPGDPLHYSLLDHLRHLLAEDPALTALGMKGGLMYWLPRNTQQVELNASALQADWQAHRWSMIHQSLIRILDYLDGSTMITADVPSGTPLLVSNPFARVGLLTLSSKTAPPGFILHTDIHLEGIREAVGVSPAQQRLAEQLRTAMNMIGFWLTNVRQDALPLVHMDDAQLAQRSTLPLLIALATQAQDVFFGAGGQSQSGQLTAVSTPGIATNDAEAGTRWIAIQSQSLVTFSWQPVSM